MAIGSTPLHFAAANGHLNIVKILLRNGAVPDRPDKHGVTPEMLAREHGWLECAELLREWAGSRKDDLPPIAGSSPEFELDSEADCTRKLHMKRSIDNALGLFKSTSGTQRLHHHGSHGQLRLPPSPARSNPPRFNHSNSGSGSTNPPPSPGLSKPFGEYSFYSTPDGVGDDVPAYRRPSLPHIFHSTLLQEPPAPPRRQASMSAAGYGRAPRRPRSAGNDADQGGNPHDGSSVVASTVASASTGGGDASAPGSLSGTPAPPPPGPPRKLGSKMSLKNLFRRANTEGSGSPSPAVVETDMGNAYTTSPSVSPIPIPTTTRQLSGDLARSSSSSPPSRPSPGYRYMNTSSAGRTSSSLTPPASPIATSGSWYRARMGSETGVRSPLVPSAVELHHQYSIEHLRDRDPTSSDASSPVFDNDEAPSINAPRPSILLRRHNRSNSSQSQSPSTPSGPGSRILRFDSSSSMSPSPSFRPVGLQSRLRGSSISSLGRADDSIAQPAGEIGAPDSAPANTIQFAEEEEAEAMGENTGVKRPIGDLNIRQRVLGGRPRGTSFASSTSSASPGSSASYALVDYPFGPAAPTERSPLSPISAISSTASMMNEAMDGTDAEDLTKTAVLEKGGRDGGKKEPRGRGMSISSMDTEESANANVSLSSSAFTTITLPSPQMIPSPSSVMIEHFPNNDEEKVLDPVYQMISPPSSSEDVGSQVVPTFSVLRNVAKGAAPLDLRGISNLAEAEALVEQTLKEILEAATLAEDDPNSPGLSLSEQILAYGELLAVKKRFARGERQLLREQLAERSDEEEDLSRVMTGPRSATLMREGDYAATVKARSGRTKGVPKGGVKKSPRVRRPHTAEGASRGDWGKSEFIPILALFALAYIVVSICLTASLDDDEEAQQHPTNQETSTPTRIRHAASRSASSPLQNMTVFGEMKHAKSIADIQIVETSATPVDSPQTPEPVSRDRFASAREVKQTTVPSFPPRSRTPDPEIPVDAYTTGVPLVRVATAPLEQSHFADSKAGTDTSGNRLGSLASRRKGGVGGAQKLARMGFSIDTHNHQLHYSPPGSHPSSRSPSKPRFGGIKSLVQSLKGKP